MNKHHMDKKNGSAIIGFMLAVMVLAMIFGGLYYGKSSTNDADKGAKSANSLVETLNNAKSDIGGINKKTEAINEATRKEEKDPDVAEKDESAGSKIETTFSDGGIKIFNIIEGQTIASPIKIEGEGVSSDNTLVAELRDEKHNTKVSGSVAIKSGEAGKNGSFAITLHFQFSNTKEGYVAVYEKAAEDSREKNLVEIPVKYLNQE
jgi:hypothetical protein